MLGDSAGTSTSRMTRTVTYSIHYGNEDTSSVSDMGHYIIRNLKRHVFRDSAIFRRNISPAFSGTKSKQSSATCLMLASCLALRTRTWEQYFPPKYRLIRRLRGVISKTTEISIFRAFSFRKVAYTRYNVLSFEEQTLQHRTSYKCQIF